ncbi:restriction endonuclease subunit S [Aeromonas media]
MAEQIMQATADKAIPAGYKQTEVGVIPEDWEATTVGQVTNWLSGGTPNRKREDYWQGDIPWISGSTLKTLELETSDQFLTSEGVEAGSKMAPLDATLLLVRGSALHSEIRAGLVVAPLCFNQDVKALIPNKSIVPRYLTIYLLAMENELLKLVSSAGNSAGVLDTELVKNFKFLQPPKHEQTAIANVLSDSDALIDALEQLIAKKQAIKTAAMQQLLTGRTRLPQFALRPDGTPKGYKSSELGQIPEDWVLADIRSISAVPMQNGLFYEPIRKGKGVPLINVGDMYTAAPVDVGLLELFDASLNEIKLFKAVRGDLFFTRSSVVPSGIAYCNIFDSERNDVVFDSHLIRVRPNVELVDPKYLYLSCISKYARSALIAEAKTATMTTIDQGAINSCPVLVPPKNEQTAIATILSDMDNELQALTQKLEKARALKQGMMQQLLTGRIRLPLEVVA